MTRSSKSAVHPVPLSMVVVFALRKPAPRATAQRLSDNTSLSPLSRSARATRAGSLQRGTATLTNNPHTVTVGIITISDRASRGLPTTLADRPGAKAAGRLRLENPRRRPCAPTKTEIQRPSREQISKGLPTHPHHGRHRRGVARCPGSRARSTIPNCPALAK